MPPIDETPHLSFELAHASDGSAILRVSGEVDTATAPRLEAELRRVIRPDGGAVEIDLADVGFIDSSGLRALIVARQLADEVSCALVIGSASAAVARILDVTGLTEHFART